MRTTLTKTISVVEGPFVIDDWMNQNEIRIQVRIDNGHISQIGIKRSDIVLLITLLKQYLCNSTVEHSIKDRLVLENGPGK